MRDITPYRHEEPRPSPPPRPVSPATDNRKRRLSAFALAGLLTLALIAATAGTIVASVKNFDGGVLGGLPFSSLMTSVSDAYRKVMGTAGSSYRLLALSKDFVAIIPSLLRGERGGDFLALLERAQTDLELLDDTNLIPGIAGRASDLGAAAGSLHAWLTTADERRVAVVFGNSAEMRAGGGFIGSYAEITLRQGAIKNITVRDINDADTGSGDRTIPPVPLEPIVDRWRAADANWFLSGPASGSTFLDLLNRSPLYRDQKVDAVVFVAPRVVSDILAITGPVKAGDVEVDKDSFLRVIQEEVQEGQASNAETPKAILSALVPAFTDRVLSSFTGNPLSLFTAVSGGLSRRDIVGYSSDPALQRSIEALGIAGGLYPTDENFVGTYIAVAPSTIGGDKTDAVTTQDISVREQLLAEGLIETTVSIERTHRGKESDPWWYKEEHRSYVKVYAPLGAEPTVIEGNWVRDRFTKTYDSTFSLHPSLSESLTTTRIYDTLPGLEAFSETGKQAFGFWQRTARGSGTVASVTYARQLKRPLSAGRTYDVVLERQPASTGTYSIEIFAPAGLVWQETGTSQWTFTSNDPAGRTIETLTLENAN